MPRAAERCAAVMRRLRQPVHAKLTAVTAALLGEGMDKPGLDEE
jgi:hypothetical protein